MIKHSLFWSRPMKPNCWCEHNIDADLWDLHWDWVVLVLVVPVLTLGMGSGVQWWGGGGTGHHGLLGAHAGPGGRRRQTEKPPRKASNQSAPIHRRQHGDPNRTGGGGAELGGGQEKQGVSQAGSLLPAEREDVKIKCLMFLWRSVHQFYTHKVIKSTDECSYLFLNNYVCWGFFISCDWSMFADI